MSFLDYAYVVVSAPIVGTTSLENLKELTGEHRPCLPPLFLTYSSVEAVHIKLTEEDIKYLEEPYPADFDFCPRMTN